MAIPIAPPPVGPPIRETPVEPDWDDFGFDPDDEVTPDPDRRDAPSQVPEPDRERHP